MDFNEYQIACIDTAIYMDKIKENYELPEDIYKILGVCYAGLGLGEAGEVQGKIKKIIRDAGGEITNEVRAKIGDELGDLLYYVAAVCSELEINMGGVAEANVVKLQSRKQRGKLTGDGDDR